MKHNLSAGFAPVSDVQVFTGVIPPVKLIDIFESAPRPKLPRLGFQDLIEIFFAIAVLEGALHEDDQSTFMYSTCYPPRKPNLILEITREG
jgi:hypothetical protein